MADYSLISEYNSKVNSDEVLFGADSKVLNTELNEMQETQKEARRQLIQSLAPSGFTVPIELDYETATATTIKTLNDAEAYVDGMKIFIPKGTLIDLGDNPTEGIREDLLLLEVWRESANKDSVLTEFGGEGLPTVKNYFLSDRVGEETARRILTKWRLRCIHDVDFSAEFKITNSIYPYIGWNNSYTFSKIYAKGANKDLEAPTIVYGREIFRTSKNNAPNNEMWNYNTNDPNLWVAGAKNEPESIQRYKTVDGLVFGLPIARLNRRAKGGIQTEGYKKIHPNTDPTAFKNCVKAIWKDSDKNEINCIECFEGKHKFEKYTGGININGSKFKKGTKYTLVFNLLEQQIGGYNYGLIYSINYKDNTPVNYVPITRPDTSKGMFKLLIEEQKDILSISFYVHSGAPNESFVTVENLSILEGDWTEKEIILDNNIASIENRDISIEMKGKTLHNLVKNTFKAGGNLPIEINIPVKPNTDYTFMCEISGGDITNENIIGALICSSSVYLTQKIDEIQSGDELYTLTVASGKGTEYRYEDNVLKNNSKNVIINFRTKGNENYVHLRSGGSGLTSKWNFSEIILLEGTYGSPIFFEGIKGASDKGKNLFSGYDKKIKLQAGKTYFLSSSYTKGATRVFINNVVKEDLTIDTGMYWNEMGKYFALSTDREVLGVEIHCNNDVEIIFRTFDAKEYINIQLEEGVKQTEYELYYKGEKVKYKCIGKNLIDIENIFNRYSINYTLEDGIYTFYTNMSLYSKGIYFPKDNAQYSISCKVKNGTVVNFRIAFAYTDGTYSSTQYATNIEDFMEIKATSTVGKQVAYIRMDWTTDGTVSIKDLQIERGTQSISKEPYRESRLDYLLPEGCSFNGLNDIIQDTIEEKGKSLIYTKNIEKVVLNGSENWGLMSNEHSINTLAFQVPLKNKVTNNNILSNRFIAIDGLGGQDIEGMTYNGGDLYIRILKTELETPNVEGLKKYLQQNNIIVYYQLTKPEVIKIKKTGELYFREDSNIIQDNTIKADLTISHKANIELKAFGEVTHISSNNSMPPVFEVGEEVGTNLALQNKNGVISPKLKGRTLQNIVDDISIQATGGVMQENMIVIDNNAVVDGGIMVEVPCIKPNTRYTIIYSILENKNYQGMFQFDAFTIYPTADRLNLPVTEGINKVAFNTKNTIEKTTIKIATTKTIPSKDSILKVSKNIIILEGDWTDKETPNYFEGIKSAGEREGKIIISSRGKNLFDKNSFANFYGLSKDANGNPIIAGDFRSDDKFYMNTGDISIHIQFKNTGHDFLEGRALLGCTGYDGVEKWLCAVNDNTNKTAWGNFPHGIKYLRVVNWTEGTSILTDFICCVDKKQTDGVNPSFVYEPYKKCSKELQLQQSLAGLDNIQDIIEETEKGVIYTQNIRKVVLDGTGDWNIGRPSGGWKEFDDTLVFYMGSYIKPKYGTKILSDKFPSVHDVSVNNIVGISNQGWGSEGHFAIRLKKSELQTPDTEGFIKYLKANPITAYYVLVKPEIIPLKTVHNGQGEYSLIGQLEPKKTESGAEEDNVITLPDSVSTIELNSPITFLAYNRDLSKLLACEWNTTGYKINSVNSITNEVNITFKEQGIVTDKKFRVKGLITQSLTKDKVKDISPKIKLQGYDFTHLVNSELEKLLKPNK